MRKNTIPTERAVWRLNKPASLLVVLLRMALKELHHCGAVWQQAVFLLGFGLVRICPNDKLIEIFVQKFDCLKDPFYKFFALNLLLTTKKQCLR